MIKTIINDKKIEFSNVDMFADELIKLIKSNEGIKIENFDILLHNAIDYTIIRYHRSLNMEMDEFMDALQNKLKNLIRNLSKLKFNYSLFDDGSREAIFIKKYMNEYKNEEIEKLCNNEIFINIQSLLPDNELSKIKIPEFTDLFINHLKYYENKNNDIEKCINIINFESVMSKIINKNLIILTENISNYIIDKWSLSQNEMCIYESYNETILRTVEKFIELSVNNILDIINYIPIEINIKNITLTLDENNIVNDEDYSYDLLYNIYEFINNHKKEWNIHIKYISKNRKSLLGELFNKFDFADWIYKN